MKFLQFSYDLSATATEIGWATAVFTLDGERHELLHAYTFHPLQSVASVALRIAKGIGVPPTAIVFDAEPSGYIARFTHRDPTSFTLTAHNDIRNTQRGSEHADAIVSEEIESLTFAVSVACALHSLYRRYGELGFLRRWSRFSFPMRHYWHLRLLLDSSPLIDEIGHAEESKIAELEGKLLLAEPIWSARRLTGGLRDIDLPEDVLSG